MASAGRTAAASLPLAAWCGAALVLWPAAPALWLDGAWLAGAIAGGAGLFWVASVLLGAPERVALVRMLPSRERAGG